MEFDAKIEKGIPAPAPRARGVRHKYPFLKMEVGDSFAIPLMEGKKTLKNLYSAMQHYKKTHDIHCVSKQFIEKGMKKVRVWRIK